MRITTVSWSRKGFPFLDFQYGAVPDRKTPIRAGERLVMVTKLVHSAGERSYWMVKDLSECSSRELVEAIREEGEHWLTSFRSLREILIQANTEMFCLEAASQVGRELLENEVDFIKKQIASRKLHTPSATRNFKEVLEVGVRCQEDLNRKECLLEPNCLKDGQWTYSASSTYMADGDYIGLANPKWSRLAGGWSADNYDGEVFGVDIRGRSYSEEAEESLALELSERNSKEVQEYLDYIQEYNSVAESADRARKVLFTLLKDFSE